MSNDPGYIILQGIPPTREAIEAAKAEFPAENLQKFQQSISSLAFEKLGCGQHSEELLHDGLDLLHSEYLGKLLLGPYESAKSRLAENVVWMQNPKQLPRMRAGQGRVFIYKAVEEALGVHNGFFRVVEGSHRMTAEQSVSAQAKNIRLEPGQVIILDGDLVIEYPQVGGGVGLLKWFEKILIGRG